MIDLNVTTQEQAACLRILQAAIQPITAAELAVRLGLGGQRETQRRHIRAIVEELRADGVRVIAFNPQGYWLVKTEAEWLEYCRNRENYAKRIIGEASRRIHMATDHHGQGLLFVRN